MSDELLKLPAEELLRNIAKGDELAFSVFYERYWDDLFITAYKVLKDENACKDIVQDIFLNIWQNERIVKVKNAEAYLHQSVRYKVLMQLRRGKVSQKHLGTLQQVAQNLTEEAIHFEELQNTIESIMHTLPAKCREVFRLSRVENLTNQQIAEKLGISIRTVETHISNALRRIRGSIDPSTYLVVIWLLS